MPVIELRLDVAKPQSSIPIVHIRQGDTATTVRAIITDNGAPYDFSGKYAELAFVRPDGQWVHLKDACTQVDGANTWDCTLPLPATGKAGLADLCYFAIRDKESMQFHDSTNRFFMDFDPSATTDADQAPYSDQLDAQMRQVELLLDAWEAQTQAHAKQIEAEKAEFTANEKERETLFRKLMSQFDSLFKAQETERRKVFAEQENKRQQLYETAEEQRDLAQAKNNADQAANNEAAMGRISVVLSEDQYDPETRVPTLDPSEANYYTIYSVPKKPPYDDPNDKYEEWHIMRVDGVPIWEKYNSPSVVHPAPIPSDKIDQIVAGNEATGDEIMNTTMLSYYEKAGFTAEAIQRKRDAIGVATQEHTGLVPKLTGNENEFLNGAGQYVEVMSRVAPDPRELRALIATAKTIHDNAFTEEINDHEFGRWKSTTEAIQALQAAIDIAQGVSDGYLVEYFAQTDLDSARDALQSAIDAFKAVSTEVVPNLEEFNALKARVKAVDDTAKVSTDGKDVTSGATWVTAEEKAAAAAAVDTATQGVDASKKQSELDKVCDTLETAVGVYEAAVKTAVADTSELESAIGIANKAKANIYVSKDGSDIPQGSKYVTDQSILDTFNKAIEVAETAKTESTMQVQLDAAVVTLETATSAFLDQVKYLVAVYGVEWAGDPANSKWERTDRSVAVEDPKPSVGGSKGSSPFDEYYPWSEIKRTTRNGNEMVEIPIFWYRMSKTEQGGLKIQIADDELPGYSVSPAHMDRGDSKGVREKVYVGRYHCSTGYKSVTKVKPITNITRSNARTGCSKVGENFYQWDYATRLTIQLLYLVEFADWDSQGKIGYGTGNGSSTETMGYSDNMAYHTGTTQKDLSTQAIGTQYRHIEGLWDNVLDWLDGCYYNTQGLNLILKPNDFSDTANGNLVGKPVVGSDNFPTKFDVSDTGGYTTFYPTEGKGTSAETSATRDRWYFSTSSPCLCVGGGYGRSAGYGLFFVYDYTTTNSNGGIGSRLLELP